MIRTLTFLLLVLLLSGCANSRAQYVAQHPELSPVVARSILQRRVMLGMTLEQARAASGYGMRVLLENETGRTTRSCGPNLYVHFRGGRVAGWTKLP